MPSQAESSKVGEAQAGSSPVWNCHVASRVAVALPNPVTRAGAGVDVCCACERTGAKTSKAKSDRHLVRKSSLRVDASILLCSLRSSREIVTCFEPNNARGAEQCRQSLGLLGATQGYSVLRACMGSILDARMAGRAH